MEQALRILPIPPGLIGLVWPRVEKLIGMACDEAEGDLDPDKLKARLASGNEVLVVVADGDDPVAVVVITTLTLDGGRKVLFIPACAGRRMSDWLEPEGMAFLRQLAQDQGCDGIRACGRPGWVRALKTARALHQIIEFN